jgi:plasmid stabilization system protein ParE
MPVDYTADAGGDMRNIVRFGIENDLPDPAAYVRGLRDRTAYMAAIKHPGRKGRADGTREWVLTGAPYIVVDVAVWRVLHGAQQRP